MAHRNTHFIWATLARFTAYFAFSAAVVTAIMLSLDYQQHRFELSRSEAREAIRLSLTSKSITHDLREVIADLRTLANQQVLGDYLDSENQEARVRVENAFVNVGESARIYDQIRYIDSSGLERIRVNFRAGTAVRVPFGQLQDKSNRYYVTDTLKLGLGEIYISRLDLNIEKTRVERPFKPVIRVATPVFNAHGNLKGIIILNYLAEDLLTDFRDFMAGSWGEPNLVNAWGFWLYSTNSQDLWGFMFGNNKSLADRYPTAWEYINQHETGTIATASDLFLFSTARPYSAGTLRDLGLTGGNITERYWKVITRVPQLLLNYSAQRSLKNRWKEFLGLWALVGVLSLLLAALRTKYAIKSMAFRESEGNLAEAQKLAHIGNWVWDIPSSKISWSEEALKIFGLTSYNSNSYETFTALVHPDDRNAVSEAINTALKSKTPLDLDHRIIRPDNTIRTVHERGAVTIDKSSAAIRLFGTVQDITERKNIEDRLRESEERFRQLAENIDEVFWLTELPTNRVVYVSPAFEQVWGCTAQNLYDDPMAWTQAIVEEDRLQVENYFRHNIGRDGYEITYRISRPDGGIRWIHDRAFPVYNDKGEVFRAAGVASDITQRVEAEQELTTYKERLEKLVAEQTSELQANMEEMEALNYSLAHDLRAPLRTLTSFSQILSEDAGPKLEPKEQQHLLRITQAGKRMALMLDGIAELGRISRCKMKYRSVDLSAVAHQVLNKLHKDNPQRSVKIQVMPHLQCRGDHRLLTMVVKNLLANAWNNTVKIEDALIEFGTVTSLGKTTYYVRDNGVEFNMKQTAHLFEPFQRVYTFHESHSTDIGLAAVYRIIQRHKGRVWAEAGENAGVTFYFTVSEAQTVADDIAANG